MTDQEFYDAQEAERLEAHPEKDTIKKIQKMMAKEKSIDENVTQKHIDDIESSDNIDIAYKKAMKLLKSMMVKEKSIDENHQSLIGTETADRIEGLLEVPMKKRFLTAGAELVKGVLQDEEFDINDIVSHLANELDKYLAVVPLDEENKGDELLKEHFGRFLKDYQ